jgi:hypothetical protein
VKTWKVVSINTAFTINACLGGYLFAEPLTKLSFEQSLHFLNMLGRRSWGKGDALLMGIWLGSLRTAKPRGSIIDILKPYS